MNKGVRVKNTGLKCRTQVNPAWLILYLRNMLKKTLELLDIKVLDHAIVAGSKAVSLVERGDF